MGDLADMHIGPARRLLALTSRQGTAMAETVLCTNCFDSVGERQISKSKAQKSGDWDGGVFTDCSGNTAGYCTACGWGAAPEDRPEPAQPALYLEPGVVEFTVEADRDEIGLQADGNDVVRITEIQDDGRARIVVYTSSDPLAEILFEGIINVRERRNMDEEEH